MPDLTNNYENRRARVLEPQYRDALEVFAGNRPLTVVELRKAPATYAWLNYKPLAHDGPVDVLARDGDEGPEMVVAAPGFFAAYETLLDSRGAYQSRAAFMTAMGTLMGLVHEDPTLPETRASVLKWWQDEANFCDCSKCGGPLTRAERLERDAKLARTQYHAKA